MKSRRFGIWSVVALAICLALPLAANAADKLIVKDSAGLNTVFVVTDTGYVGAGTATPTAALSVTAQTASSTRGFVNSQHSTNAAGAVGGFRKSRGTEAAPTTVASGDYIGAFGFKAYDGTSWVQTASFGARITGTVATGSVPTEIYFCNSASNLTDCYGSGNVKMMIGATGNIGIGTTTPTNPLQFGANANNAYISADGQYHSSSSREYKENIRTLSSEEANAVIAGLNPVKYTFKNDPDKKETAGFIAEEVPALLAAKDRKSLTTHDIMAVLTQVVKDQQKTIAELSAKVEQLNQEVKLKNGFAALETR